MEARLSRRRLTLDYSHDAGDHSVFGFKSEDAVLREVVYIPTVTIRDMGDPKRITLTIEPGDTINP